MVQRKGWYNESRRHSLARRGVKTAEQPYYPVFMSYGQSFLPKGVRLVIQPENRAIMLEDESGGVVWFEPQGAALRLPQSMKSFSTMLLKSGYRMEASFERGLVLYTKKYQGHTIMLLRNANKFFYVGVYSPDNTIKNVAGEKAMVTNAGIVTVTQDSRHHQIHMGE